MKKKFKSANISMVMYSELDRQAECEVDSLTADAACLWRSFQNNKHGAGAEKKE